VRASSRRHFLAFTFLLIAGRAAAADVHVALNLEAATSIPPAVAIQAVAETSAIWGRYGVDVSLQPPLPCGAMSGDTIVLHVVVGDQRAGSLNAPLGAIRFSPDGTPGGTITVFYRDVVRFSRHLGAVDSPEPSWPSGRIAQVTARVLGRVLAHEIGHFLLRSPLHARSGLMRPVQPAPDLCMGATTHFLLSKAEVARLDRLLGLTEEPAETPER